MKEEKSQIFASQLWFWSFSSSQCHQSQVSTHQSLEYHPFPIHRLNHRWTAGQMRHILIMSNFTQYQNICMFFGNFLHHDHQNHHLCPNSKVAVTKTKTTKGWYRAARAAKKEDQGGVG